MKTVDRLLAAFDASELEKYPGLDYRQATAQAGILYGIGIGGCIRLRKKNQIVPVNLRRDDMTEAYRLVYRIATPETLIESAAFKATDDFQDFVRKHARNFNCPKCGNSIKFGDVVAEIG